MCGWCYGASSLFQASLAMKTIDIEVHCGGMLIDDRRKKITPEWRDFVAPHDKQIAALSQQEFGPAYKNNLLNDLTVVLDSEPPTTAILAAQSLGFHPLEMLIQVQKAMFYDGRKVAELRVLEDVAVENGLDREAFKKAYGACAGDKFRRHIADSQKLLSDILGGGFPSAAIETLNEGIEPLKIGHFYGEPQEWVDLLKQYQ